MKKSLHAVLRQPFYPWLVGIYPILHLYSENVGLVIDSEVISCILLVLVGTSVTFCIFQRQINNINQTALIMSLSSLAFSLSGHIYLLVFMPKSLGIWTMTVLIVMAIIVFAMLKMRPHEFFARATPSLNLIVLALLALQLIGIAVGLIELSKYVQVLADSIPRPTLPQNVPKAMDSATRPDIYYIVPDGYPSDSWLKTTENYDNSDFANALEDRGFVVVDHAQSNYATTLSSLASTLNMQYYGSNPSPFSDLDYLRLEAANSKVARLLAEKGYTYIQLLSGSLIPSPMADIIRDFTPQGTIDIDVDITTISEGLYTGTLPTKAELELIERSYKRSFLDAYFDTTLLRLARSRLGNLLRPAHGLPYDSVAPDRFLATIEEVDKISAMPEATFSIIHLLKPHSPVVFNELGEQIPWNYRPNPDEFFSELRFVNSRILHMIDSILATSKNPPVIILQSDHGSLMGMGPGEGRLTLFDIYAAYLLPSQYSVDFPLPYTTVNTFRLILSSVFGSGYDLETDKLFEQPRRYKSLFEQVDVTEEFLNYP